MARFCMITTFYPPYSFGGDAIYVQALSHGLAERGHQVDVVHCRDSYDSLAPRQGPARPAAPAPRGVTVHTLKSPLGILSPLATHQTGRPWLKAAALHRLLAAQTYDVIHFHNVSLIGGPAVLGFGSALKLYTLHEHWLLCPTHTLFRDNREPCTEKKCISCSLRYARPPQLWRYGSLLRRSVEHVDLFLAPTDFTRRLHLAAGLPMRIAVLESFHQPLAASTLPASTSTQSPGRPAVASTLPTAPPQGASAQPARVPAAAAPPPRPFFLYAGRLERIKGVATLIATFRDRREADLLIAGAGSEAAALRRLAAGCDHIRFLGAVPRERLAGLFAAAVAVVVPSVGYEVFPLVILEAFAAATPVIARDLGPLGEILRASGGGLLFANHDELDTCLGRMLAEPALRQQLGAAGQQAWQARWTLPVHLERYLALVEQLRAAGPRAPRLAADHADHADHAKDRSAMESRGAGGA
jgi:glycosyltransferase involved in cell wall biosynthesis